MNYDELVKELRVCGKGYCGPNTRSLFCLKAADAIEELQSVVEYYAEMCATEIPRWISVKERLPEEQKDVLVYLKRGGCAVDYFIPSRNDKWGYKDVTHWMTLPSTEGLNDA